MKITIKMIRPKDEYDDPTIIIVITLNRAEAVSNRGKLFLDRCPKFHKTKYQPGYVLMDEDGILNPYQVRNGATYKIVDDEDKDRIFSALNSYLSSENYKKLLDVMEDFDNNLLDAFTFTVCPVDTDPVIKKKEAAPIAEYENKEAAIPTSNSTTAMFSALGATLPSSSQTITKPAQVNPEHAEVKRGIIQPSIPKQTEHSLPPAVKGDLLVPAAQVRLPSAAQAKSKPAAKAKPAPAAKAKSTPAAKSKPASAAKAQSTPAAKAKPTPAFVYRP